MTATKYIKDYWAQSGDVSPVPDNAALDGSVSYTQGFTLPYELVQTDPGALNVPRDQFNQVMSDITKNVQQYQQIGAPNFILAAQNGGVPYPYAKYSIVTYDDGMNGPRTFISKVNANSSLPTVTADWLWFNNTAGAVVFDNAIFDGAVINGDAVYWDTGSSTFKKAIANGSTPQNVLGFADITFKRVFSNGDFTGITGLTAGNVYYLSTTTAGQITNIKPVSNIVQVGFSKSSTELFVNISQEESGLSIVADVSMSLNQLIPNGSDVKINFDTVNFDTNSLWDAINQRFNLTIPGYYRINATYVSIALGATTTAGLNVYKNGVFYKRISEHYAETAGDFGPSGTCIMQSNGADYVEMFASAGVVAFQIAGATPGYTTFEIEYLGA